MRRQAPEGLVSRRQLAAELGIDQLTVGKWAREGKIPVPIRIGRYWFFDRSDLATWLESKKAQSRALLTAQG